MIEAIRSGGTPNLPSQVAGGETVVVKQGETLEDLARSRNISIGDILAANPQFRSEAEVRPGSELRLPPTGPRVEPSLVPGHRIIDGYERVSRAYWDRFAPAASAQSDPGSGRAAATPINIPTPTDAPILHQMQAGALGIGRIADLPGPLPMPATADDPALHQTRVGSVETAGATTQLTPENDRPALAEDVSAIPFYQMQAGPLGLGRTFMPAEQAPETADVPTRAGPATEGKLSDVANRRPDIAGVRADDPDDPDRSRDPDR